VRPVNLIPGEQRLQPSGARAGSAYVVIGVLAVLLAMVAVYTLTSNNVKQRKADAAEAKAEADQLESRARSLGAFTMFSTIKETRLASVRTVADSRFDWERLMRELSRVIPDGSWLLTVDASTAGAPGDASTTSQTGTSTGPPAAQIVGCAPRQSEVAKMMVHLRELHKFSDVKLNQSARSETSGTSGVEGCDRYQFDVTVTFGALQPKEAPRGTNRVPASLGGGS
jgi:Tfp pilus assembly protein PilN